MFLNSLYTLMVGSRQTAQISVSNILGYIYKVFIENSNKFHLGLLGYFLFTQCDRLVVTTVSFQFCNFISLVSKKPIISKCFTPQEFPSKMIMINFPSQFSVHKFTHYFLSELLLHNPPAACTKPVTCDYKLRT